ncbi:MAG TPA: glycosyltransferase family 2 protein [Bacteroidia bacterium]|mgnify:CR=1 FL=1|nr:glycosyltransferase family 2 protein [Bacteroidia bacterium]
MSELSLAVVILNFNGKHFLEKFLPGIIKFSSPHPVIVADNGSTDDSVLFMRQNFPDTRVIENKGNFGYAKGYNMALKQVEAQYYVLLNSDVEVTGNWIDPVLALMQKDQAVAACQPKILDHGNRRAFEYAGASGGYIDKFGYPFCRGRVFNSLENDEGQFNNATEIFWATGACLFVRSKPFWQVGGLDEDYFAHMEEIDLCWRLKNLGYKIYVEPASVIYHIGGGTLNKLSSRKTFLNFRNNLSTLAKNHPPAFLFPKIIYRLILDGVAALKFLSDGQPKHFWAVLRAHFAFYSWLPAIMAKRRALKKLPGFKFSVSQMYKGNIVLAYFVKNKRSFSELHKGFF